MLFFIAKKSKWLRDVHIACRYRSSAKSGCVAYAAAIHSKWGRLPIGPTGENSLIAIMGVLIFFRFRNSSIREVKKLIILQKASDSVWFFRVQIGIYPIFGHTTPLAKIM